MIEGDIFRSNTKEQTQHADDPAELVTWLFRQKMKTTLNSTRNMSLQLVDVNNELLMWDYDFILQLDASFDLRH